MILISGIIILIIELILIVNFFKLSYKNKVVFSKSNFLYFIPIVVIMSFLYIVGQVYATKTLDFFIVIDSIKYAFKVFAFDINKSYVALATQDSFVFALSYYIAVVLGGLTLVSAVISLVKVTLVNFIEVNKKKNSGADIIIGYNNNSIKYAKRNPNSIIWIDSTVKKMSSDEKTKLFNDKIAFIYKPFNSKNINIYLNDKFDRYHFIAFNDNNDLKYTKLVDIFVNDTIETTATVFLHLEAPNEYINFVNNQMSKKAVNSKYKLIASCFNVHELIARKFTLENTFIDYLKEDSIENGILKNDINVFFLGFGKTNFSMFQSSVLNNQFVGLKDNKLYNKQVNYYLYDVNEDAFNKELLARLHFDYYDRKIDDKIPPIEKICNVEFKKMNIKSDQFIDEVEAKMKENSHNIFFVSFSSGVENASFAEVLEHYFFRKNIHIYYNIDNRLDILSEEFSSFLTPYGFKNEILTHDVIANDSLAKIASNVNDTYNNLNLDTLVKWEKLPIIEKYSNVYNAINLRFKLKMIGFNYDDILSKKVSKEEYYSKYFFGLNLDEVNKLKKYDNYEEYFNINIRQIKIY